MERSTHVMLINGEENEEAHRGPYKKRVKR